MMNTQTHIIPSQIKVWDRFVRLFHWLFAAGILAELALGFLVLPNNLQIHAWIGYGLLALVGLRVVWGLAGAGYARFSTFPPSPRAALDHLRNRAPHTLGHNPLGALMVYALISLALIMILSGIAAMGGLERSGLAANISVSAGETGREIHAIAAILFLILIPAHWIGIVIASRQEKQNLARAMVNGKKFGFAPPQDLKAANLPMVAVFSTIVAAVAIAAIVLLDSLPLPRMPSSLHPQVWAEECGVCHTPHHASLMPAACWNAIMVTLDDHFGEDASLPAASAEEIRDWLVANSAENFDSKAAVWFRKPDSEAGLRITATARWKGIHEDLPDDLFNRKKVASKANCGACHTDALNGRFSLSAISIPAP